MLVVLLGAMSVGGGGFYLVKQGPGGVGACPPSVLRIVATPDIAPLVRTAAKATTKRRCPSITVAAQEPATTVRDIRAHPPEVWIPSTTAWLRLTGTGGGYPATGTSLARSPLVVAVPRALARSLGWPAKQPTWADLADGAYAGQVPRFSVADPLKTTSGLLAVLGSQAAFGRSGADADQVRMRTLTLRSRLADANADPAKLLRKATDAADPARQVGVFPVTEQVLWSSIKATGSSGMVGLYPPDGLIEADYPLVMSARMEHDQARRPLVDRLVSWLRGGSGARALVDRGFRPAHGTASDAAPSADGLVRRYASAVTVPPDPGTVTESATTWSRYRPLTVQVMLLVDASASMNDQVTDRAGRPTTKAALLRESAQDAVRLFGKDTSAGLWQFPSARAAGPYDEVVPFGPLAGAVGGLSRRDALGRALAVYRASGRSGAPLYDTILRGQAEMRRWAKPNAKTLIFVLSDGHDSGTGGRAAFLSHLTPDVPVYGLGYGLGADMTTLQEAARLTGGQAMAATRPADLDAAVAAVFLAVHGTRAG
ncbi:MAG: Ca-activated chloride channel [Micromonosporaceae bacterium]|nr:Ca-activated chloride channel [Micromonosporaceae bacterium]